MHEAQLACHISTECLQTFGQPFQVQQKEKTEEKIRECKAPIFAFGFQEVAESKRKFSLLTRFAYAIGAALSWKRWKHEIPPKLNMYETTEYRIEIDIQFIIIFRLFAMYYQLAVGACIHLYGTIASRAFVRAYINEFIIIISFMRTHSLRWECSRRYRRCRRHYGCIKYICTKPCLVLSVEFDCAFSLLHLLR